MSHPGDGFEIRVEVAVYRRINGEQMSLRQNWNVDGGDSTYVFRTLAEFGELADRIKEREAAKHE